MEPNVLKTSFNLVFKALKYPKYSRSFGCFNVQDICTFSGGFVNVVVTVKIYLNRDKRN